SYSSENENYVSYLQGINSQITDSNQEIFRLENIIKSIEHECIQTYNTSLDILESDYLNKDIGMSDVDARKMVRILQAEIKALGPINETVLVDLESKQKEYENISGEYEDSLKAHDEIKRTIEELDKKAIADFMNVINNVNKHIPAIFNELFGGGFCEIKLTNPDSVLESGIDIVVKPIGKKVKNLTLLSGGEKTMVALTVLFAILNSSNLPLIVLDEAEAALDELNVETFARIIKKYSDKSQFLVITHRPGTMKESSVLYGVTMQDKGVSIVMKTSFDKINFKELE
ncbi:MAG: chromosome segregation protein SMC, partial [Ureaplasma sp.]|nr:chromosome segregation protein SMC [Ureaplasma sp.]